MDFKDKLDVDQAVFGQSIIQNCILRGWKKKLWACWKVLTGEAGILLLRVSPEDLKNFKEKEP